MGFQGGMNLLQNEQISTSKWYLRVANTSSASTDARPALLGRSSAAHAREMRGRYILPLVKLN